MRNIRLATTRYDFVAMIGIAIRNPDPKVFSGFLFTTAGQIGAVVTNFAGSAVSAPVMGTSCKKVVKLNYFFN